MSTANKQINRNLRDLYIRLVLHTDTCCPQVKVDAKTKSLLDEHKRKKSVEKKEKKDTEAKEEEEGETKGSDDDDDDKADVDEIALQEDVLAKVGLDALMQEFADDLCRDPPEGE